MESVSSGEEIRELKELHHNIDKIKDFVPFQKEINMVFYDIPGMNDSMTKKIYYEYPHLFMAINR